MLKNNKAFTLVELIVVIAIMGTVLAIGIPATHVIIDYANKRQCIANQKLLMGHLYDYQLAECMNFEPEKHLRWEPGTYDPNTHEWTSWDGKNPTPQPIYYYNNMQGAIRCKDYGEYFMRQFYGGENSTLQLPSTGEGCQLYITFYQTEEGPQAPYKYPKGYVEIHCICEAHNQDEPLTLNFDETSYFDVMQNKKNETTK